MHLLIFLYFFLAYHDIVLKAVHVPGVLADAISRNHLQVLLNSISGMAARQDSTVGSIGSESTRPDVCRLEAVAKSFAIRA